LFIFAVFTAFFTNLYVYVLQLSTLLLQIDREMGQTLSEPVTAKHTSSCQNSKYKVGSSCMQGWRISILLLYRSELFIISWLC